MKSDFQVLLEQAKAEMENIRREEERQKAEKERRDLQAENKMQDRDRSGFLRMKKSQHPLKCCDYELLDKSKFVYFENSPILPSNFPIL